MGDPPYALTPAQYRDWAGAVEDETMFKNKKQLLPKDLAARAEKVNPRDVEAEVLKIINGKPTSPRGLWETQIGPMFPPMPGGMVPVRRGDMSREVELLNQLYSAQQQQAPWTFPPLLGL